MANTSYYLYQKWEKRGEQDWIPVYPNEYSIDANETMPLVVKAVNDPACGYIPPSEIRYRWVNLDPSIYWICDEVPPIYRWQQSGYTCVGYDKYQNNIKQVSYDSGTTWENVSPAEYSATTLIEQNSEDCGYVPPTPVEPIYRWQESGYTCVGYDKYQNNIKQVSYDSGTTWTNVSPAEYSATTLIEQNSEDCGYVPPIPTGGTKFIATYSDSTSYSAECSSSTTLTYSNLRPSGYTLSAMTDAVIGDCVTSIGDNAFNGCNSLTSVTIPDSVISIGAWAFNACTSLTSATINNGNISQYAFSNCSGLTSVTIGSGVTSIGYSAFTNCTSLTSVTIGSGVTSIGSAAFYHCSSLTSVTIPDSVESIYTGAFLGCTSLTSATINNGNISQYAFSNCSGLTSVTIGSGVTSIGSSAFYKCSSLTSVTISATTPPTLGNNAFDSSTLENLTIYVPSSSVETYKAASGWSTYASRIQAIPNS